MTVCAAVRARHPGLDAAAARVAQRFGLPRAARDNTDYEYMIECDDDGLSLCAVNEPRLTPLRVTLASPERGLSRRQPFARALGRDTRRVIDATAGLGHDALLAACLGCEVIAIERVPAVAALLDDALARAVALGAPRNDFTRRLSLVAGDARALLPGLAPADAIYLDPMFPPKRKRGAASKKAMLMLRALAGDDDDAGELLALARTHARRVVVKRADDAPPLAPAPDAVYRGKLVRYDVYLAGARA